MSDENTLDAFITTNTGQEPQKQTEEKKEVRLEDEFAKLLNDFIQQDQEQEKKRQATLVADQTPTPQKQNKAEAEGLENFLQNLNLNENSTTSANQPQAQTPATQSAVSAVTANQTADNDGLKAEEHELARAVSNFQDGIYALADKKNLKMPTTDYNSKMLSPNYKPSVGKKIAQYMLECWDLINHYDPESLKKLPKDAGDEELAWRQGEPIGLWTKEYERKPAYAGFADGLAGVEKSYLGWASSGNSTIGENPTDDVGE